MDRKIAATLIIVIPLLLVAALGAFAKDEKPFPLPDSLPMAATAAPEQRVPETIVRYVDPTAGGADNGTSWGNAYADLQTALANSSSGTHLWLAEGTYTPGITRTDSFHLVNGVSLFGGFPVGGGDGTFEARFPAAHPTILSGEIGAPGSADNSLHVVKGDSTITNEIIIDGITIADGSANLTSSDGIGAGLYLDGSTVTLRNCRLRNHTSSVGTPALRALNMPQLKIDNCLIADNTTSDSLAQGAAVLVVNSAVEISNSQFRNNNLLGNTNGPLWLEQSDLTMVNTVFYNNPDFETIILTTGSTATIDHVTMTGGTTAIRVRSGNSLTLTNSILWGNGTPEIALGPTGTATVSDSVIAGGFAGGTNILNSDPIFVNAAGGDLRLQSGSPAADSANATTCAVQDLRGYPRPLGSNCDMGAYESPSTVTYSSFPALSIPDNDPVGVTDTINTASNPVNGLILDANVQLAITHLNVGDLVATVRHDASGRSARLVHRPGFPGCAGHDISAWLDDEADLPVKNACVPAASISGSFVPDKPLATFDKDSLIQGGTWSLNISDNAQFVSGTLQGWLVELDYKPALVVTRLDDPPPDGCNAGDCSLREAIITANSNVLTDTIVFDVTGTIMLTQTGTGENATATGDLDITDDLMLVGRGTDKTIVDGGGLDRVFHIFNPAAVTISNLTIQNGLLDSDTDAEGGAGIRNSSSKLVHLQGTIVQNNHATGLLGGAILATFNNMIIEDSVIFNNSANVYGAIYNQDGTMQLINSTVYSNTNMAMVFDAIHNRSYFQTAVLDIQNSTITDNGPVRAVMTFAQANTATTKIQNSIINGAPGCGTAGAGTAILTSFGHNIGSDNTCNLVAAGDKPNSDPLLDILSDNGGNTLTTALLPGSPAIDAGDDAACTAHDQRGFTRIDSDGNFDGGIDNNPCDIGAFERLPLQLNGTLLTSTTVRLTWNDSVHDSYELWQSLTPYDGYAFLSSQNDMEEDIALAPAQNKYYEVYGVFGSNTAERSNRVGVFSFALVPGS